MEEKIVQLLRQNDRNAIVLLYRLYGNAMYGVVLKMVPTKDMAQQVMQETFVKAWRCRMFYDETRERFFTWLLNSARCTARDVCRRAGICNYGNLYLTDNEDNRPDPMKMRKVMNQIEEKYNVLIELIYYAGYSPEEAATATGIPLSTVRLKVRYVISALARTSARSSRKIPQKV
ncbi:MAG: RNA polymerase sigma factor [Bacteroidetes bacterium]|nr:MAG: RNA polymerase sigma factor [Bacteroidota bacterium]